MLEQDDRRQAGQVAPVRRVGQPPHPGRVRATATSGTGRAGRRPSATCRAPGTPGSANGTGRRRSGRPCSGWRLRTNAPAASGSTTTFARSKRGHPAGREALQQVAVPVERPSDQEEEQIVCDKRQARDPVERRVRAGRAGHRQQEQPGGGRQYRPAPPRWEQPAGDPVPAAARGAVAQAVGGPRQRQHDREEDHQVPEEPQVGGNQEVQEPPADEVMDHRVGRRRRRRR